MEGDGLRIKELEHVLEEKRRSVVSLEDHISTLKFHLEQKSNELEDAKRLLALNAEKGEQIMEQMRRTQGWTMFVPFKIENSKLSLSYHPFKTNAP